MLLLMAERSLLPSPPNVSPREMEMETRRRMNIKNQNRMSWYLPVALVLGTCVLQPTAVLAQKTSSGLDCSQLAALQINKQDNLGAGLAMIECGLSVGGRASGSGSELTDETPAPPNLLVSNRTCTSGSSCTKSESNAWANPKNGGQTI